MASLEFLKQHNEHLQLLLSGIGNLPDTKDMTELQKFSVLESAMREAIQQSLMNEDTSGEIALPVTTSQRLKARWWRITNWTKSKLIPTLVDKINDYIKAIVGVGSETNDA